MRAFLLTASVVALLGCAAPQAATAHPRFEDVTATHLPPRDSAPSYATMDAQAADLDGDGDLDLVAPQEWRPNRILINDGQGRFTHAADALPAPPAAELIRPANIAQPLQKDTEDVSIADFDRDGDLDLIMVVEDDMKFGRANVHQYFRAIGNGRYERIYNQLPDTIADAIAHADITGDGADDIIISGEGQDRLLINDGRGNFGDETDRRLPRESATAQDVEFVDVDRDGDLDLVLGLEGGHVLWINTNGVFADESSARLPAPGNVEARKVTPADVDGDGDADLYFSHVNWQGREPQDRLYINDGAGRFSDGTVDRIPTESELSLDAEFADFDGDGDLDLVQGNAGNVRIFTNDGTGRFTDVTAQAISGAFLAANITIEVADFNGDGKPDIFIGQLGGPGAQDVHDRLYFNRTS